MREDGYNEIDTGSWVVANGSQEEPAAASAPRLARSHAGFLRLLHVVCTVHCTILFYVLVEIFSNCPGEPQSCSEAGDD